MPYYSSFRLERGDMAILHVLSGRERDLGDFGTTAHTEFIPLPL